MTRAEIEALPMDVRLAIASRYCGAAVALFMFSTITSGLAALVAGLLLSR